MTVTASVLGRTRAEASEAEAHVFRLLAVCASTGVDVVMIFLADPATILHPTAVMPLILPKPVMRMLQVKL